MPRTAATAAAIFPILEKISLSNPSTCETAFPNPVVKITKIVYRVQPDDPTLFAVQLLVSDGQYQVNSVVDPSLHQAFFDKSVRTRVITEGTIVRLNRWKLERAIWQWGTDMVGEYFDPEVWFLDIGDFDIWCRDLGEWENLLSPSLPKKPTHISLPLPEEREEESLLGRLPERFSTPPLPSSLQKKNTTTGMGTGPNSLAQPAKKPHFILPQKRSNDAITTSPYPPYPPMKRTMLGNVNTVPHNGLCNVLAVVLGPGPNSNSQKDDYLIWDSTSSIQSGRRKKTTLSVWTNRSSFKPERGSIVALWNMKVSRKWIETPGGGLKMDDKFQADASLNAYVHHQPLMLVDPRGIDGYDELRRWWEGMSFQEDDDDDEDEELLGILADPEFGRSVDLMVESSGIVSGK